MEENKEEEKENILFYTEDNYDNSIPKLLKDSDILINMEEGINSTRFCICFNKSCSRLSTLIIIGIYIC
jgi:hypothetical protein